MVTPKEGGMPFAPRARWCCLWMGSLLAVAVVVAAADEADAVVSGENGRIAFVSDRDGNDEIYLMDADGTNLVNLTNHPADDRAPAWSPDGLRIAFASNRDGNDEIHVMEADGTNVINLTNHPANDAEPSWSPDGHSIAFTSDGGVFAMDADGTNRLRLTDPASVLADFPLAIGASDTTPVWSSVPQPHQHRIAFVRTFRGATPGESTSQVYTIQAVWWEDTTGVPVPVFLADGGWENGGIDWAPRDQYLAVSRVGSHFKHADVALVSESSTERLPNPGGWTHAQDPAVAPDGSRIAASVMNVNRDPAEIMVMNPDGADPANLTNHPAWDSQPAWQPLNPFPIGLVHPATGKWFLRDATGRVAIHYFGIGGDRFFLGDWDCDGVDTSGAYRPSNDTVYLRNSNTTGVGELSFRIDVDGFDPATFGQWANKDQGAVLAGDWDGDGCDTIAVFQSGEVSLSNTLPPSGGTLAVEQSYLLGDEFSDGRRTFAGDFNGDGKDTVGVQYFYSTAEVSLNYVAPTGPVASIDQQFWYGSFADGVFAGDWSRDGTETVACFRPNFGTVGPSAVNPGAFFFRFTNTTGFADHQFFNHFGEYPGSIASTDWDVVSGDFSPGPVG